MVEKATSHRRRDVKRNNLIELGLGLAIVILLNIIGSFFFTRIDLTSEKRYSLSKASREMLRNLDDIVYFRVYLEGDLPAGFKRLRNETREMLNVYRAYNKDIQYEFIDPSAGTDANLRQGLYQQLSRAGIEPTSVRSGGADKQSQQLIFPGAIVSYKGREVAVQLLQSQMGTPAEEQLNNSLQQLEYNLSNAIHRLSIKIKPSIAFTSGHGEFNPMETGDIRQALSQYYNVDDVVLDGDINSLTSRTVTDSGMAKIQNRYKAIIIAGPDSVFSDKDRYVIDQYIMYGGKVLWMIDPVFASMDSLQYVSETYGLGRSLRLDDLLFKYGVRLNTNLLMDMNANPIPINTQPVGSTPRFEFFPWYYSPVLIPRSSHPIVRNINSIRAEFISRLDTVYAEGVRKQFLLETSQYSRIVNTPVRISLDILQREPDPRFFEDSYVPVAVLLEGSFESAFRNRLEPEFSEAREIGHRDYGDDSKMIVVADADIIRNQVQYRQGIPELIPLGMDKYNGRLYGNKDFVLNAVNYLCDDGGLLEMRTRELKMRLLDKAKVEEQRLLWQVINVLLPILVLALAGLLISFYRRRTYRRLPLPKTK